MSSRGGTLRRSITHAASTACKLLGVSLDAVRMIVSMLLGTGLRLNLVRSLNRRRLGI